MNLIDRAKAPTPKFFRIVRNIGLIVAAVGGALIASPVTVPTVIVTIGSYLTVIGGVLTAVSQVTVDDSSLEDR